MKYCLSALFLLLAVVTVAQQEKWQRVRIYTGNEGLRRLALQGVTIDHGAYVPGASFTGEFSQREVAIIRNSGLRFDVLIDDMTAWYREQNASAELERGGDSFTTSCGTYSTPRYMTGGSMGGFYTYAELLAVLDSMAARFPKLITVRKPVSANSTTAEGRPLYYVKISDQPNRNDDTEPKVLYTALHHAREPQSLTQLVYFMWLLLENYKTNPVVRNLVDSLELYFIPCLNPDGYIYNELTNPSGGGYWRKNRRNNGDGTFGVDLNRNYGYKWGFDDYGSSPLTWSDVYRGTAPFSEPETKMVRSFCTRIRFSYAMNNHAYGNYLIYPFGYKAFKYTADSATFAGEAALLSACNDFLAGTTIQTVGYTANGNSDDWMYGEQTTKSKVFAYTAETGDVFDGFWPRKNRIIPLAKANVDMNLVLAQLALQDANRTTGNVVQYSHASAVKPSITGVIQTAPNPASSYTTVYFDVRSGYHSGRMQLVVVNALGVPVLSTAIQSAAGNVMINTGRLTNGVYFCYITDGRHTTNPQKLVVAH